MMKSTTASLAVALMVIAGSLSVAVADGQRVLLPIVVTNVAGANGTLWESRFFVHNRGPQEIGIAPEIGSGQGGLASGITIEPSVLKRRSGETPGEIITITGDPEQGTAFELLLRDVNHHSDSAGIEIPVVREKDFQSGEILLIGVPTGTEFRTMLRVYETSIRDSGRIRVRVLTAGVLPQEILLDTILDVRATTPFEFDPGYAQMMLDAFLAGADGRAIDVEIQPLVPGMRFWAFVSSTSNTTQSVTLITPQ